MIWTNAINAYLSWVWEGLTNLSAFREAPIAFMSEVRRQRGDMVRLRLGVRLFHFCCHPRQAQRILKDNAENYPKSRYIFLQMEPIIGRNALVSLEGERWQKYRRRTNQFFHPTRFESFLSAVDGAARNCFEELDEAARSKTPINLVPVLTRIVLNAAGKILFSTDLNAISRELVTEFMAMNELCGKAIRNVVNWPTYLPTHDNLALKRHYGRIQQLFEAHFRSQPNPSQLEENIVAFFREDCDLRSRLPRTINQMIAFLYPAFETTSSSLSWTAACLGRHPETQEKIADELSRLPLNQSRYQQSISQWPYLLATYQETLRLYPPAWILARESVRDDMVDGNLVRKGETVFVSIREIHRHPEFWDRPNQFEPERFLNPQTSDPFAYIPFGAGPRICSGAQLGTAEALVILGRLCERFRLSAQGSGLEVEEWITQRPRGGVWVTLTHR